MPDGLNDERSFSYPKPFLFLPRAISTTNPPAQRSRPKLFFCLVHHNAGKKNNNFRRQNPIITFLSRYNKNKSPHDNNKSIRTLFYLKETNKDDQFDRIKSLRPSPNHQRRASSRDGYASLERERFDNPQDERPIHVTFHSRSSQGNFHSPGGRICKYHLVPSKLHCHSEITSFNGMPSEPVMEEFLHDEEFESLGSALVNRLADSDKSGIEQPPEQ